MTTKRALPVSLLLWTAMAAAVFAADHPLGGSKLVVKDPSDEVARRKVVVMGTDGPGSSVPLAGDPVGSGAVLRLVTTGGTPADVSYDLPGIGWTTIAGIRWKYTSAPGQGPVDGVVVKRSATGTVKLKARLSGRGGPFEVVPPAPATRRPSCSRSATTPIA